MTHDPSHNPLTGAEAELESALARLAPAPGGVLLETIAWEAGRRSAARSLTLWRSATAAAMLLAASLSITLAIRTPAAADPSRTIARAPSPPPSTSSAVTAASPPSVPEFSDSPFAYTAVRDRLLAEDPSHFSLPATPLRPLVAIDRAGGTIRPRAAAGVLRLLEGI